MLDIILASIILSLTSLAAVAYLYIAYKGRQALDLKGFNDLFQASTMHFISRLRGVESRVEEAVKKAEAVASKIDFLDRNLEERDFSLSTLAGSLKTLMEAQVKFSRALRDFQGKLLQVDGRLNSVEAVVKGLKKPSPRTPTRPVFPKPPSPVQEEVSFTNLNPTEMEVLRLLYVSGPKTASEVREVIGRSREHTARLMKKLYLEGYVERDAEAIPFTYKLSEKIKKSFEFSVKSRREAE